MMLCRLLHDEVTDSLAQLWTLQTVIPTLQEKCAQYVISVITVIEVNNHSLVEFEGFFVKTIS